MNSKASPCKYYLTSTCHRGDACNYSHQKPSPRVCKYFLKGGCTYGNKCLDLHKAGSKSGNRSGIDRKEANPSPPSNEFSDREKESDTSNVEWDHNPGDQRGTDSDHWNDGALDGQQSEVEDNRNNEKPKAPCIFFSLGGCSKGDDCGFAHLTPSLGNGTCEAGNDQPSPSVQNPIRKKEICKHHLLGRCRMGDSCRLKHPRNGQQRSLDTTSARNQHSSTSQPSRPTDSAISVASNVGRITPSTSARWGGNEEDASDAQDTDTEPINADEDNYNQSKGQDESNHSEMGEQGTWPGSHHDERQLEEIQPEVTLPNIPQQRVHESTQSSTTTYPHVSEVSLQVHWSQFADPLANPEIPFCKPHAQGQCIQGECCRFRHSITVEEYNILFRDQQPNLWTLSRDRSAPHALRSNVPPPSFSAFPPSAYAHYSQLSPPQAPATLVQSAPLQPCKFHPLGTCRNGNSCPYLHSNPPVENENTPRKSEQVERSWDATAGTQVKSDTQLCKYFVSKKGCTRGKSCTFSHGYSSGDNYPSSGPSRPRSSTSPAIEDQDNGWAASWGEPGNDTANNNGWGQPDQSGWNTAGTDHWDKPASTPHSMPKSDANEWPPTDESSHSAPWVAAPVPSYHAKGAKSQLRHDVEAQAPGATNGHSRPQPESPQPQIDASKETSHDQTLNTNDDAHQWADSKEGEIEAEAMADRSNEENNDAEPQDLIEEESALEVEQQCEPVPTSAIEHTEIRFIMKCDVSFGSDGLPNHITTATETNKVTLSNLPLDISPRDIEMLVEPYGKVRNSISLDESEDSSCIEVEFFDQGEARAAFKNLEGHEYEGRNLRTSLQARMVAIVRSPTHHLNLKVLWPNPYTLAWSHYPTIKQAKDEADRLNGIIIRGRTVVATFVTPNKAQKTSFAIKLENLALEVQKSDLEDVCKGSTLITIEKPPYSIDATNSIRSALCEFGSVEDFDTEPRTNTTTTSRAFVMFRNEGVAKKVVEDLDGQPQESLGKQALKIRSIYYSRFRIPRKLFDAIKTDLELLKEKCEESKKCTIQHYDHRRLTDFVWVRLYSPTSSHSLFAEMSIALAFFMEGTVLRSDGREIWDEYFETPSSANALEKIQEKTTTFIHCDHRTKNIRIFGGKARQEDAEKSLMKLIGKVHTQRHEIDLPRPKLRPIVDNGFRSLQNDIGMNKVSIDVVHSKLIVRGSSEDVGKAHNVIAAFAIDDEAVRDGPGGCQICHCDPSDSITLSCNHAYCKACLHFAIKQPSQVPFCCISERTFLDGQVTRCEMPLGLGLIQRHFPLEKEELLRATFLHHIRSRREDLFFCPSLECEAVHRAGDESVNIRCSLCAAEVCTFCRSHAHIGLSCAERKALVRM